MREYICLFTYDANNITLLIGPANIYRMQKIVIKYTQKTAGLIFLGYPLQCLHSKLISRMGFEILWFFSKADDNVL